MTEAFPAFHTSSPPAQVVVNGKEPESNLSFSQKCLYLKHTIQQLVLFMFCESFLSQLEAQDCWEVPRCLLPSLYSPCSNWCKAHALGMPQPFPDHTSLVQPHQSSPGLSSPQLTAKLHLLTWMLQLRYDCFSPHAPLHTLGTCRTQPGICHTPLCMTLPTETSSDSSGEIPDAQKQPLIVTTTTPRGCFKATLTN